MIGVAIMHKVGAAVNLKNIQQVVLKNGDVVVGIHCNILEREIQIPMTK